MDINTITRIMLLAQPQLSAEDYAALRKTVLREHLYDQIDECEKLLSRKVYPTSERPLMDAAQNKKNVLEQQLARL